MLDNVAGSGERADYRIKWRIIILLLLRLLLVLCLPSTQIVDATPNNWPLIQQHQCMMNMELLSMRELTYHNYNCVKNKITACIHDTNVYNDNLIMFDNFCGTIDAGNIKRSYITWILTGKPWLLMRFLHFSLAHDNWWCKSEKLMVTELNNTGSTNMDFECCGKMKPFDYKNPATGLNITFFSNAFVAGKDYFRFHYHWHEETIVENRPVDMRITLYGHYLYIANNGNPRTYHVYSDIKIAIIELQFRGIHNSNYVKCYDGPSPIPGTEIEITKHITKYFYNITYYECIATAFNFYVEIIHTSNRDIVLTFEIYHTWLAVWPFLKDPVPSSISGNYLLQHHGMQYKVLKRVTHYKIPNHCQPNCVLTLILKAVNLKTLYNIVSPELSCMYGGLYIHVVTDPLYLSDPDPYYYPELVYSLCDVNTEKPWTISLNITDHTQILLTIVAFKGQEMEDLLIDVEWFIQMGRILTPKTMSSTEIIQAQDMFSYILQSEPTEPVTMYRVRFLNFGFSANVYFKVRETSFEKCLFAVLQSRHKEYFRGDIQQPSYFHDKQLTIFPDNDEVINVYALRMITVDASSCSSSGVFWSITLRILLAGEFPEMRPGKVFVHKWPAFPLYQLQIDASPHDLSWYYELKIPKDKDFSSNQEYSTIKYFSIKHSCAVEKAFLEVVTVSNTSTLAMVYNWHNKQQYKYDLQMSHCEYYCNLVFRGRREKLSTVCTAHISQYHLSEASWEPNNLLYIDKRFISWNEANTLCDNMAASLPFFQHGREMFRLKNMDQAMYLGLRKSDDMKMKWTNDMEYISESFPISSLQPFFNVSCIDGTHCVKSYIPQKEEEEDKDCFMTFQQGVFTDYSLRAVSCREKHYVNLYCLQRRNNQSQDHSQNSTIYFQNDLSGVKITEVAGNVYSVVYERHCPQKWIRWNDFCFRFLKTDMFHNSTNNQTVCSIYDSEFAKHLFMESLPFNSHFNEMNNPYLKIYEYSNTSELHKFMRMFYTTQPGSMKHDAFETVLISESLSKYIAGPIFAWKPEINYTYLRAPVDNIYFRFMTSYHFVLDPDVAMCEKASKMIEYKTNCADTYFSCNDGTCLSDALVCDGHKNCLNGEDEEDAQCPDQVCSAPDINCFTDCLLLTGGSNLLCQCNKEYYFQCLSGGGCIPIVKLCDGISHCTDSSDEPPTCITTKQRLGSHEASLIAVESYLDKLRYEHNNNKITCPGEISETLLLRKSHKYAKHFRCPQETNEMVTDMKIQCIFAKKHQYASLNSDMMVSASEKCSFGKGCMEQKGCPNRAHLHRCEEFNCDGRFKCRKSYCLPLEYVCDGQCDCLLCEEESWCKRPSCPGMVITETLHLHFKCSLYTESNILKTRLSTNTGRKHHSAEYPVYVNLHSTDVVKVMETNPELITYLFLNSISLTRNDFLLMYQMISLQTLTLTNCDISNLLSILSLPSSHNLIVLDLSNNLIRAIPSGLMCFLRNVRYLSLANNLLTSIDVDTFLLKNELTVLLLQSNLVWKITLSENSEFVKPELRFLSSDLSRLCCFFEVALGCHPSFPLWNSEFCSKLFQSVTEVSFYWTIATTGLVLNALCILFTVISLVKAVTVGMRITLLLSLQQCICLALLSLPLLYLSIINHQYSGRFGITADQRSESWECSFIEFLFTASSNALLLHSTFSAVFFTVTIKSLTKKRMSLRKMLLVQSLVWILSISTALVRQATDSRHKLYKLKYYCLPLLKSIPDTGLAYGVYVSALCLTLLFCCIMVEEHLRLVCIIIKQMNAKIAQNSKSRNKKYRLIVKKNLLSAFFSLIAWIPPQVIQAIVLAGLDISPRISLLVTVAGFSILLVSHPIKAMSSLKFRTNT